MHYCKARALVLRAALASPAPGSVQATLRSKELFPGGFGSAERKPAACRWVGSLAGSPPMGRQQHPLAAQVGRAGKAPAARQTPAGARPSPLLTLLFPSLNWAVRAEQGFPEILGWQDPAPPCTPLPGAVPPLLRLRGEGVPWNPSGVHLFICRWPHPAPGDTGTGRAELCAPRARGLASSVRTTGCSLPRPGGPRKGVGTQAGVSQAVPCPLAVLPDPGS